MADFALIALIGLLLLIPLEIVLLVILYALKRSRQRISIYGPKKIERYGWEDYLKLPPEKKQQKSRRSFFWTAILIIIGVAVVIGVVAAVLVPLLSGSGGLSIITSVLPFDLSKNASVNGTVSPPFDGAAAEEPDGAITGLSPDALNDFNVTGFDFSSVNLTAINLTMPALNVSALPGSVSGYVPYVVVTVVAAVLLSLGIAASIYVFYYRRNLVVINKARKTAEKLSRKTGEKAKTKSEAVTVISGFRNSTHLMAVLIALLLFAILIYVFLGRINWVAEAFIKVLSTLTGFVSVYVFYILGGIVLLVVAVIAVRRFEKKDSEKKPGLKK